MILGNKSCFFCRYKMSDSLQCYNKGCGQKFKTEENKDGTIY